MERAHPCLSPIYCWTFLNSSTASFFCCLSLVMIIGRLMESLQEERERGGEGEREREKKSKTFLLEIIAGYKLHNKARKRERTCPNSP